MAIQYSTTHRSNCVTDIVTLLGSGSYLLIYTGSPPANCAATATGTLLASLPLSSTAGTVSSGVLTLGTVTSQAAAASGTAGYWRLCTTSTGTTVIAQGTVAQTGGDLNFSSTSFSSGETIGIGSFTITANGA